MIVVSDTTPLISLLEVGNARRVALLESMTITGTVGILEKAY